MARRVGLVLGAGGTLGAAWMVGALGAVERRIGRPLRGVDLMVGTSAGSILAAALRCGITVDTLVAHQRGEGLADLPDAAEFARDTGRMPPLPRFRLGSPGLLASAARAPLQVHPRVAASALLPAGRAQHRVLHAFVSSLSARSSWPRRPTWIISVNYGSGRRVAFGRTGAPAASLADAVVASCSIPGWHEPRLIDGQRYVDGGVRSVTSLDLLSRAGLDEVYVLAPMAGHDLGRPLNPALRTERFFRNVITSWLMAEVRKVEAAGTAVTVLTPGPADVAAIGLNLMDPGRRLQVLETSLATARHALGDVPRAA
ncbi:patatin [Virgisporangium aliadipatigenens]|uniref:Patatin n=1 Tax=Virgisporangium aliadipatigenens TaxID=741659 RepID=A0A8J3YP81_9ACTN|nr:patatin-like phospholipase family protein [Virgisporangium aliadipatigenens]GIJ48856.1 patatin [Virgisporangium aliadipatigenens]